MAIDLIKNNIEDIYKIIRDANIPRPVATLLVQQHEQMFELQRFCNELLQQQRQIIDAIQLSQALHKQNKEKLDKIERRYQDPYLKDIKTESPDDAV